MDSKKIDKFNIKTYGVYSIFILFGLNIKLAAGIYLYNILIFIYIIIEFKTIKISLANWMSITLVLTISIISIGMDSLYTEIDGLENFIIPIKAIIFLSFIMFIDNIKNKNLNYNIILIFISMPIFLSILMFHNSDVSTEVLSFYGLEKYEGFGRFGGAFGKDVNSLGMYSSLTLIFAMILHRIKLARFSLALIIIILSLYAVVLSGMRAGLLVYFSMLIILNIKLKIINYNYLFTLISVIMLYAYIYYLTNENSNELLNFIFDRYSLSVFLSDFDYSGDGGNLNHMIKYFYLTLGDKKVDLYQSLFGVDSGINFVDNFYVNVFLKHGLLFITTTLILVIYYIIKFLKTNNMILMYFFISTLIIAIKGTFIYGNYYMFLVLFASHVWITKFNKMMTIENYYK
jgi:hypothetical protein